MHGIEKAQDAVGTTEPARLRPRRLPAPPRAASVYSVHHGPDREEMEQDVVWESGNLPSATIFDGRGFPKAMTLYTFFPA
jgi:hypothetical protein